MYTFWFKIRYFAVFLVGICLHGQVNGCRNSTTQVTIDMNWYNNDTDADLYVPADIILDSSMSQFISYSHPGSNQDLFITKIWANGLHHYSKRYNSLIVLDKMKSIQLSNNGTFIRVVGQTTSGL